MNIINKLSLCLAMSITSICSYADEVSKPFKLPPMLYFSTLEDVIFEAMKQKPIFSVLDKELYGSPIRIGITHTFAATAGGTATGLTSAMLAGGSLGLLPIVSNNDLIITYVVTAHGKTVATFSYSKNFTQATNIYSNQGINHLDKTTLAWVTSTIDNFVADVLKNDEIKALTNEYNFYFGDAAK